MVSGWVGEAGPGSPFPQERLAERGGPREAVVVAPRALTCAEDPGCFATRLHAESHEVTDKEAIKTKDPARPPRSPPHPTFPGENTDVASVLLHLGLSLRVTLGDLRNWWQQPWLATAVTTPELGRGWVPRGCRRCDADGTARPQDHFVLHVRVTFIPRAPRSDRGITSHSRTSCESTRKQRMKISWPPCPRCAW